jgi:hypothetical protein
LVWFQYSQPDIEKTVKTGDLDTMAAVLQEGRRLLSEMVDVRYIRDADPILDAFRSMIDGLRRRK